MYKPGINGQSFSIRIDKGWLSSDEDGYIYVRCNCTCHSNPDIKHMVACCDNGWIKIKKEE